MAEPVFIKSIQLENFCGFDHYKAECGAVTVIEGQNGEGKTSLLDAVRTVFEGGSDPAMIRRGKEEAIVTLTLSNGYTAIKKLRPKGFDLEVRNPDGGAIKAPKAWISQLAPAISFDPLRFLAEKPEDRAAFLLKTLPINFTAEEVNAAARESIIGEQCSLARLNEIRELKYSERKSKNVSKRDLEGMIQVLRKALPDDDSMDWIAEREKIGSAISELKGEIRSKAAEIEAESKDVRRTHENHASDSRAVIEKDYEAQKSDLMRQLERIEGDRKVAIASIETEFARAMEQLSKITIETLSEQTSDLEARKSKLDGEYVEARTRAEGQTKAAGQKEAIAKQKKVLDGYILDEMRLTGIIEALDRLKNLKLKQLDVEGFDLVMDGRKPVITINQVPIDRLNRQQQIYLAMQFVQHAHGTMPLMICECAELDESHREDIASVCRDSGIQLIITSLKDKAPLRVLAA